jgi:cell division protein FtsQ
VNTKATIRKILLVTIWVCIGGGMLTLLVAAIGKKNRETCSNYVISIKGAEENYFIDTDDILSLLKSGINSEIVGKKTADINLHQLEQLLRDNVWIKKAELWFDNQSVLHVEVMERVPVARIFTTAGNSFYIDSSLMIMPLSDKMITSVPMFTGFTGAKNYSAKDSLQLSEINAIAQFIKNDPFWFSQVAQIDITNEGKFEISPVIGNHLVKIGKGNNLDGKFSRLMTFYKQVLVQKGFDAYSIVDVQYDGQVVATKRGTQKDKVDTVALKKNIERLLKEVQQLQNDSLSTTKMIIEKPQSGSNVSTNELRATNPQSANPNAMKAQSLPEKNNERPKAVMQKKN